jgi:DNA-binding MarR family transcriptional regulator
MVTATDRRIAVWRAFLQAHAAVTAALDEELLAERDMPLTWYDVLVNLRAAPGGRLRMQELADAVLFSRSGLTRLVDRMVRAGLLRREPCPDDRRGTFAVLTADGKRTLRKAAPVHLRGIGQHFTRHLTDADVRALGSALQKVLRASENAPRRPGETF